ncbi:excalibur calcium-binding domain-containing protein [Qaidamihabitans albus]|uniref:excalibur calcium-binding domain-containing protein n=1 Tax=Qaidamihabitans albus TaxID=2795733 RepID=UPI0027DE0852|nr:excalibur calcium-binding domain-containing protein [Qaidamihabitans albus]
MSLLRRTLVVVAAFAIAGFTYVGTAGAEGDLNCLEDFTYQEEAQAVYDADPTDPHNLDGHPEDGVACESLPNRPVVAPEPETSAPEAPKPAVTDTDKDCKDFASHAEAQATYDADPSDPHRLDGDNDGIACEDRFGASDGDDDQQVAVYPTGGVATGGYSAGGRA